VVALREMRRDRVPYDAATDSDDKGCPDRWDLNQYAADIRDFLGDYESRYDVVGENQEGYINPNTVATKKWCNYGSEVA